MESACFMETAVGTTPWREARPILLRVSLLLLACLALVPLNPSGIQLYRYPFDTLRSPAMRSLIGEWRSPNFHEGLYRPLLLLWLLLLIALASSRSRPTGTCDRSLPPYLLWPRWTPSAISNLRFDRDPGDSRRSAVSSAPFATRRRASQLLTRSGPSLAVLFSF